MGSDNDKPNHGHVALPQCTSSSLSNNKNLHHHDSQSLIIDNNNNRLQSHAANQAIGDHAAAAAAAAVGSLKKLIDPPSIVVNSSSVAKANNDLPTVKMVDNTSQESNNHHHHNDHNNHHTGKNSKPPPLSKEKKTLALIHHYLKNIYEINDDLNEDEIIPIITKMNNACKKRRRHRQWLMRDYTKGDTILINDEKFSNEYWMDEDILDFNNDAQQQHQQHLPTTLPTPQRRIDHHRKDYYNNMAIDPMINIVDDKFFATIIDGTEESCNQILDDNVIMNLRKSLAMSGKGKIRKRRDIVLTVIDDEDDDDDENDEEEGVDNNTNNHDETNKKSETDHGENEIGNNKNVEEDDNEDFDDDDDEKNAAASNRRRTRRMIKESQAKIIDDRDESEMKGLDALIAAMTEIEESEGRSIGIQYDDVIHQSRRLRARNKVNSGGSSTSNSTPTTVKASNTNNKTSSGGGIKANASNGQKRKKRERSPTIPVPAKKKKKNDSFSPARDNDGSLYALVPPSKDDKIIDPKLTKINVVIVNGKPIYEQKRQTETKENRNPATSPTKITIDSTTRLSTSVCDYPISPTSSDAITRKRAYKKRQAYGKRGPYKKRGKKNEPFVYEESTPTGDTPLELEQDLIDQMPIEHSLNAMFVRPKEFGPVSLRFLDWRRRKFHAEKKASRSSLSNPNHSYSISSKSLPPGVDSSMYPWDVVHKATEQSPSETPTMEPPRQRHSNNTYGRLCNQLLNCLQGKGRVFARHEFFYSDLDKAWFNDNVFANDLLKLGIDPNIKLTRSEWSIVRRKMKRRPRIFSRKFVREQTIQLKLYRQIVRKIQIYGRDIEEANKFHYDVQAPPRVGTTITAYHPGGRLVHRGTVLYHDKLEGEFLIQFERKELGWDWVSDFEVASHGVPEIIGGYQSNIMDETCTYDSYSDPFPCATSFAPLLDFYKREPQFASNKLPSIKLPSKLRNKKKISRAKYKSHLLGVTAEREILAKLMNILESNLERKRNILDAIETFQSLMEKTKSSFRDQRENFKSHYEWLQESLKQTNQVVEAALIHQQVMYGKLYTGNPMVTGQGKKERVPVVDDGLLNERMLRRSTVEIGREMASKVLNLSSQAKKSSRDDFLSHTITSAIDMILTADLSSEMKYFGTKGKNDMAPIVTQNQFARQNFTFPQLPKELMGTVKSRELALEDLKDSVQMLQSELMCSIDN